MTKTIFSIKKMVAAMAAVVMLGVAFVATPAMVRAEETEATVTFEAGELSLITAPSFDFGVNTITAATEIYNAATTPTALTVSDLRGSGEGWAVTASLSSFELNSTGSGTTTLNGAIITLNNGTVSAENGTTATAPTAQASVQLTAGGASDNVVSAAANAGQGVWSVNWTTENATLTVLPGTAQVGTSYAVIDWALQSAP